MDEIIYLVFYVFIIALPFALLFGKALKKISNRYKNNNMDSIKTYYNGKLKKEIKTPKDENKMRVRVREFS
jgi:hypothetical protein